MQIVTTGKVELWEAPFLLLLASYPMASWSQPHQSRRRPRDLLPTDRRAQDCSGYNRPPRAATLLGVEQTYTTTYRLVLYQLRAKLKRWRHRRKNRTPSATPAQRLPLQLLSKINARSCSELLIRATLAYIRRGSSIFRPEASNSSVTSSAVSRTSFCTPCMSPGATTSFSLSCRT